MKRIILYIITGILVASCSDNNELIGSSIDNSHIQIHADSSFVYTAESDSVYSRLSDVAVNRAIYHMLGRVGIQGFADIDADYLTEFRYIGKIDTKLVEPTMLDSMVLTLKLAVNQTIGDKLAPMQVTAYQLDGLLTPARGDTLFTDIDPANYCDFNTVLGERVFSSSKLSYPSKETTDTVQVTIPISRDGMTTKQLATDFYNYYVSKGGFISEEDMDEYLPGVYVKNTYGSGAIVRISSTIISLYHKSYVYNAYGEIAIVDGKKKEINAVTPILVSSNEVESVNRMDVKWASAISSMADAGKPIMTTPLGYQTHIIFPVNDIIKNFNKEVSKPGVIGLINSVTLSVPILKTPKNDYNITPPPYLVLMRADANATDSDNKIVHTTPNIFFYDRLLPDGVNTFFATYSASTNSYEFGNIQSYITNILKYNPNSGADNNYKADSNMILVPVGVIYDSSNVMKSVFPFLTSPCFAQIDTKNIKIKLIYSTKTY